MDCHWLFGASSARSIGVGVSGKNQSLEVHSASIAFSDI